MAGVLRCGWRIRGVVKLAALVFTVTAFAAGNPATIPLVESVVVDGVPIPHRYPILLSKPAARIEFHYTVPAFMAPERVVFRYRLRGSDDENWTYAGNARVAGYTNLAPGLYEFVLAASLPGSGWVASPETVVLRLPAPFYRSEWFIALCVLGLAPLVWLSHQGRARAVGLRHAAVLAERARIAGELHDTIAQGLTGLTLHVEGAIDSLDDPGRAREYLQIAKKLARNSLTEAKRALFDLRPEPLDGRDLPAALQEMLELMTDQLPVRGSLIVRGQPRRLPELSVEKHLLRIGQEGITNALRHARATMVEITLEFEPSLLRLSIRDDGQGSGPYALDQLVAAGHGLRGMRDRAKQVGARFAVRQAGGKGLEIVVEVPA